MPEPVYNAVCGPTVPGSKRPSKGSDLSKLNPCPLKACCNVWGQCGLSDDFCVESKSESGAPGTSGVKNGCVSNCGRDIIKGAAPATKINIAYFEAWNKQRSCLTMDVTDIDINKYSHIHFAFAEVTRDFSVDISKVQEQFDKFKRMSGIKRIISFGGWDFSALPETYNILREAVQPENRDRFKNNIVSFVNEHGLDGVDLDWEYPGAPDIPDIPSDDPHNGINYYKLLTMVKSELGSSKSVSFAAPSSYWYLKAYPIQLMAKSLDYLVYMTYDLHGQWDYGNKWTSPGCPTGNCLRSHVNVTETIDALSMITKAGAPSGKVVVGVASYGRSFKMAAAGCEGPQCLFTGSARQSNAAKGRCTDTAGYISNAEISEIISSGRATRQWKEVGSNMLVYDDTEWVSYMDDNMKTLRSKFYDMYNFAGTTDWAVDLQRFVDGSDGDDDSYDGYDDEDVDINGFPDCVRSFDSLDSLESHLDSLDPRCLEQYLINVEVAIMQDAMVKYDDLIKNGAGFGTFDSKCPQIEFEVPMISGDPHLVVIPNSTFELTDADGFWKDIGEQYGIEESWIKWGRRHMRSNNGCQYGNIPILECIKTHDDWWEKYPNVDDDEITVYNPKKIISDSYEQTRDMLERFVIMRDLIDYDLVPWSDAVDSVSVPALSVRTAVDNMEAIVKRAKEIEKSDKIEFILNMVMGVLFMVPFVGQAAEVAGMIAVRTILRLIDEAGQAGMAIFDIVQHPDSAFMTIFTTLVGSDLARSTFKDAAAARREMSRGELNTLGPIKKDLERISGVRGGICKI
ncbi:hypothetical protein G3M48_002468 [Beauveria asiatica]|uniref:chitinase n=1 Tax=Beauveria asiatica TaxID=1069075 RepID=A0AAW0RY00_9HYPO